MATLLPVVSRSTIRRSLAYVPRQALTSARRAYTSTMHDNDPEVLEREKRRVLDKEEDDEATPIESAPGWNERLASASEAAVKADQTTGSPIELQQRTVQHIRKRREEHPAAPASTEPPEEPGVSTHHMRNNGPSSTAEAPYAREEIDGPLGSATGGTVIDEQFEQEEEVITKKRVA